MNCARHNWHPLPVGSPTMSNSFRPSDAGSRHVQDSNNFSMKLHMIADCQTSFYGDSVWIFYPPVFILGFAKQTPGTSQKPKCMATLKLGKSAPVWQRKFCGCCSNFVFNYIGVAYFNLVGRISSKSWKYFNVAVTSFQRRSKLNFTLSFSCRISAMCCDWVVASNPIT